MSDLTHPVVITPETALFLDFDGTLVAIQDDPDLCVLPDGGAQTLVALSAQLGGALAAISGRDVRDLSQRVPLGIWRAGGHGLEMCAPGESPGDKPETPERLTASLEAAICGLDGVRLEPKGPVVAIHYRAAPRYEGQLVERLQQVVAAMPDYRLQHGKMVFEAKPVGAHKGRALARMMQHPPFEGRRPVMVGDDTTDEDAMIAALELGGAAIKVGPGESVAPIRVNAPSDIWALLETSLT
ncbi:MAG: trehalose-phosphatase [Pseudomonadota bacterium]